MVIEDPACQEQCGVCQISNGEPMKVSGWGHGLLLRQYTPESIEVSTVPKGGWVDGGPVGVNNWQQGVCECGR